MNGFNRQSADEKRWLRVLSTLNEFQAGCLLPTKLQIKDEAACST
jgi:hypothetical protein